jgi:hypothetical protein
MYPFMTLEDNTEIVHSETYCQNGIETVKVYIETPIHLEFKSAECYLPKYEWKNIDGYSEKEMEYFKGLIKSVSHIIIQLAREGGLDNATNF